MRSRGYRCRKRMWSALLLTMFVSVTEGQQEAWHQERPPNMPQISNLEVMCAKDHMEVQLSFDRPFNGLVFSKGAFAAGECGYVQPQSGRSTYRFSIMYNGCGTKPDMNGKFYENTVVVQYDEELIEVWDEAKRLRCEWYNDYEKTATKPPMVISDLEVVELNFRGDNVDCWMEIQNGKGPWASPVTGIVPLGSTMTMVVAINDLAGEFDMRVKSCEASDGTNRPILLSDEHGCVLRPKMVSKFLKLRNNDGRATVMTYAFFHAFKFPDSMHVHIRCKVEICRFGCPEHCERVPAGQRADQVAYLSEVNATIVRSEEPRKELIPKLSKPVAIPIPVKRRPEEQQFDFEQTNPQQFPPQVFQEPPNVFRQQVFQQPPQVIPQQLSPQRVPPPPPPANKRRISGSGGNKPLPFLVPPKQFAERADVPSRKRPVASAQVGEPIEDMEAMEQVIETVIERREDMAPVDRDQRHVSKVHDEVEKLLQAAPRLESPPKLVMAKQQPPHALESRSQTREVLPESKFSERSDEELLKSSRFPFGPRKLNLDKVFHFNRDEKARKKRQTQFGDIEDVPMFFDKLPSRDGRDFDLFGDAPVAPVCEDVKVRRRREVVAEDSKSADVGVAVLYEVVSAVDLAFTPNGTEGVTVFQGRIREEIIYGVCLPSAGFTALFVMLTMCVVISVIVAGFLCYHRQIQKSTSEAALTTHVPVQFVQQENPGWNVVQCKAPVH